jgi:hypothetical protein
MVNQPRRETDQPCQSNAEGKNTWSSIFHLAYVFGPLCLITFNDKYVMSYLSLCLIFFDSGMDDTR